MSSTDRRRGPARRRRFHIEVLEGRALLTDVPLLLALGRAHAMHSVAGRAAATPQGGTAAAASSVAAAAETGQPTAHELAREQFTGKFSANYVTGPGRFTDQTLQASFRGTGGSNQSLHMNLQMTLFVPTDPTQPTTGVASLSAKNVATSGSDLILDLTSTSPPGAVGLPEQYTWTVDPSSGGVWTNAGGFGNGQGTLVVHFVPGGKLPQRATGAGRAYLVFQGAINTSGVTNDLSAPGNNP